MSMSVLIVDDEKQLTEMIAETLKQFPVFKTVICSYDGAEALRKMTNQKFDIVILDIGMPKLDGIEAGADVNTINSDPTGVTGADQVTNVMSLTTAEYTAI